MTFWLPWTRTGMLWTLIDFTNVLHEYSAKFGLKELSGQQQALF